MPLSSFPGGGDGTLVASVLTQKDLYKKMDQQYGGSTYLGAFVMAVTTEGNTEVERAADYASSTFRRQTNTLPPCWLLFHKILCIILRWQAAAYVDVAEKSGKKSVAL